MGLVTIYMLVWMHLVADFIFQTDKMAINKSKSNLWLGFHVLVYSIPFLFFGLKFAALTYAGHFITDYISSRITSKLWHKGERHWFFVVIGIDQAVHMTCLIGAAQYLGLL